MTSSQQVLRKRHNLRTVHERRGGTSNSSGSFFFLLPVFGWSLPHCKLIHFRVELHIFSGASGQGSLQGCYMAFDALSEPDSDGRAVCSRCQSHFVFCCAGSKARLSLYSEIERTRSVRRQRNVSSDWGFQGTGGPRYIIWITYNEFSHVLNSSFFSPTFVMPLLNIYQICLYSWTCFWGISSVPFTNVSISKPVSCHLKSYNFKISWYLVKQSFSFV